MNKLTTSNLFLATATYLVANTTKRGTHPDINSALAAVAEAGKFPKEVLQRACRVMSVMFPQDTGLPKTKSDIATFGKRYSESLSSYAIANVVKNRDGRVNAESGCESHLWSLHYMA